MDEGRSVIHAWVSELGISIVAVAVFSGVPDGRTSGGSGLAEVDVCVSTYSSCPAVCMYGTYVNTDISVVIAATACLLQEVAVSTEHLSRVTNADTYMPDYASILLAAFACAGGTRDQRK